MKERTKIEETDYYEIWEVRNSGFQGYDLISKSNPEWGINSWRVRDRDRLDIRIQNLLQEYLTGKSLIAPVPEQR